MAQDWLQWRGPSSLDEVDPDTSYTLYDLHIASERPYYLLQRAAKSKQLPAKKVGGRWMVKGSDFVEWIGRQSDD